MRGNSIFNFLGLASVAALASSCGNMYGTNTSYTASSSGLGLGSSSSTSGNTNLSSTTQGKYTCPALDSPNVTPQYQVASAINGYFRVCTDPTSNTDIMVDGSFGNSDQVCVFPVTSTATGTDQQYAYWEPDPSTGAPWYICQASNSSGTVFTFTGLTSSWNAAYIVDGAYVTAMQTCLIYGSGTLECPAFPKFSYGQI